MREAKPGGGEIRTVAIDAERAPFVRLAFELFASGDYTLQGLADELTDRGLRTRPWGRSQAGPIADSSLAKVLRDRYYLGYVTYKGEEFQGRHEPLVDADLYRKVQNVLDVRNGAGGSKQRKHTNYLRGLLWCGRCERAGRQNRMVFNRAVGNGGTYLYYFCTARSGRSATLHVCRSMRSKTSSLATCSEPTSHRTSCRQPPLY